MITVMQDLIEWYQKEHFVKTTFHIQLLNKFESLVEKEKEQIMNAYCDGAKGGANGTKGQHEFGWVSRHTRKKYYNQTYKN
jgi:hypothetical protein